MFVGEYMVGPVRVHAHVFYHDVVGFVVHKFLKFSWLINVVYHHVNVRVDARSALSAPAAVHAQGHSTGCKARRRDKKWLVNDTHSYSRGGCSEQTG